MNTPKQVPQVVFKTHTHDKKICGDDPFAWIDVSSDEIFKGKLFFLPCREPSRLLVRPSISPAMKLIMMSLRSSVSMKLSAFLSMMLLS
jgi:hypothetical protein